MAGQYPSIDMYSIKKMGSSEHYYKMCCLSSVRDSHGVIGMNRLHRSCRKFVALIRGILCGVIGQDFRKMRHHKTL